MSNYGSSTVQVWSEQRLAGYIGVQGELACTWSMYKNAHTHFIDMDTLFISSHNVSRSEVKVYMYCRTKGHYWREKTVSKKNDKGPVYRMERRFAYTG